MPAGAAQVDAGGERLLLLPQRAVWWAAQSAVLIADPHFGKAAAYRALGQPVPRGTTAATLARLDDVLGTWPARRLIVLGDFLHARGGRAPATLALMRAWRERHAALECVLVRGNHDSHAGDPPADLDFRVVDEPYVFGGLALRHHPHGGPAQRGGPYVLAGHLHPSYQLRGRAHERARLPCFVFTANAGVLPAFGAFTGTWTVAPAPGQRIYVVAHDQVLAAPSRLTGAG